jgi:hypothetical protein
MRGSAWPRKSCTARRSPVCKYPGVPAVWRKAWLETPGPYRSASAIRRRRSFTIRIFRTSNHHREVRRPLRRAFGRKPSWCRGGLHRRMPSTR